MFIALFFFVFFLFVFLWLYFPLYRIHAVIDRELTKEELDSLEFSHPIVYKNEEKRTNRKKAR